MPNDKTLTPAATRGLTAILILAFLVQAVGSMWDDAPTYDEMVSPAAGYAELFTGDFRLVDDHPPLLRILTALPLLAFQPAIPLDHISWKDKGKKRSYRYEFAEQFFYVVNRYGDRMIFWSRLSVVVLSLFLGVLILQWTRELYGTAAGLAAFALFVFEPNIIAHSRLATNDLIITLLIFATVFEFWRYQTVRSPKSLLLTGLLLGLAFLAKFSAILLLPMLLILAFFPAVLKTSIERERGEVHSARQAKFVQTMAEAFGTLSRIGVVAVFVVLVFYGTEWRLFIDSSYKAIVHYRAGQLAVRGHPAFLMGELSTSGWWYYFPIALVVKTPIPLLIYIVVALLLWSFKRGKAEYFLLIPVGVVFGAALASHLNIGLRHLLPAYPFLIVLASSTLTIRFSRREFFMTCIGGLAVWYLYSAWAIFPSYLAYFNEIVGPRRGYLILVDSNLDWGQDLKRLKKFMNERGIGKVYLSYFGTAKPCYYEIQFLHLPGSPARCGNEPEHQPADYIAVSATNLQSVYLPVKTYEWLKDYKPVTQIGYSIFVYDIRGNARAHNDLGITFQQYGRLGEAVEEFKLVTELDPSQSIPHANLGVAYSFLSEFAKAEASFKKALELDPGNRMAREGLEIVRRQARS